ncbi:PadR family transcriptional regulator [Candidatus Micrarchaeota archaeon]|nr:PadR family transcriptional regulator [Candidatus Micrarchaeota archaeon]
MQELQGLLKLFALSVLSREKTTGKQLAEKVFSYTGGKWKPSFGSIYPLLSKLEADGFTKSTVTRSGEVFYEITAKGKKELEKEKKLLSSRMNEHLRSCMPLLMQVLHNWSEEEVNHFREEHEEFLLLRDKLMKLPHEKRSKIVKELLSKMRSFV